MTEPTAEAVIRAFLLNELLYDRGLKDLGVEDPLLDRGLLDSMAILRLVAFCEERFGVSIPDSEVLPENLETIRAIAGLVERFRPGPA